MRFAVLSVKQIFDHNARREQQLVSCHLGFRRMNLWRCIFESRTVSDCVLVIALVVSLKFVKQQQETFVHRQFSVMTSDKVV